MSKSIPVTSQIRPMIHADLELVLAWRNHPDVRRHMYTQHEITRDEHQRWFESTLADPKKHPFIFEVNEKPLGFVNFNEMESIGIADWGFYVSPHASKGSGQQLGCAALSHAFIQLKFHKVCGQVLANNLRSINFHESLGFQQEHNPQTSHFDGEADHHIIFFGLNYHEWKTST
jgi:UDP-4-amino-4,6-dideoxy-N-acetyl-beta-L-altrosamine N-acetyltransferase